MCERLGIALISLAIGVWGFYMFVATGSDAFVDVVGDTVCSTQEVVVGPEGIAKDQSVSVNAYRLDRINQHCYYISMLLVTGAWFCLYPGARSRARMDAAGRELTGTLVS